jgi:hypothetical protein
MGVLVVTKEDLIRNLLAYGEAAVSNRIASMSAEEYDRVGEIGFKHALAGMNLFKAACHAAVEVVEGSPRDLNRKRRVWADASPIACEPNPRLAAIMKRFEEYGGGQRVGKKEVLAGLSASLAHTLPDFRYFRSRASFRKLFQDGFSYITFERGHGELSLRFGVRHDRVEEVRACLFDRAAVLATISKWSCNMGPESAGWKYPTDTTWPIGGSEGLIRASPEVTEFVAQVALPYVIEHQDPGAIRDTLLRTPGRADPLPPVGSTIFAIDCLLGRRDWLDEDYNLLCERQAALLPTRSPIPLRRPLGNPLDALKEAYETAAKRWETWRPPQI